MTHKSCEVVVNGLALVFNDYQHCKPRHTQTSLKSNGLVNKAAHDGSTNYSRHWIKDYANSEFNSAAAADINPDPMSQIHLP